MKNIKVCIALVGMLFLTSCAVTDIDRSVDFGKYRTFGFGKPVVEVKDPAFRSEMIDYRIRTTTRQEFEKRGLIYTDSNPDLVVTYQTYTVDKTAVRDYMGMAPFGYWYRPRFYGFWGYPYWGYPGGYGEYTYTEGTLIVDINDRKSGEHIWRGMVRGKVSETALQNQLDKAVKAIAKKYPVKPQDDRFKLPADDDVI